MGEGFQVPGLALLVDYCVDRSGDAGEKTHAETVSQTAESAFSGAPAEAEGWNAVVLDQRGKKGDGDERKSEIFGDGAAHVGFVDQHGVQLCVACDFGSIAEDHARGVFDTLYGEAEGGEAVEFAEALVELLEGAEGVVGAADELEVDAGGFDASLGVGDAEDDNFVAALFQPPCEGGHWIDVSGSRETECP